MMRDAGRNMRGNKSSRGIIASYFLFVLLLPSLSSLLSTNAHPSGDLEDMNNGGLADARRGSRNSPVQDEVKNVSLSKNDPLILVASGSGNGGNNDLFPPEAGHAAGDPDVPVIIGGFRIPDRTWVPWMVHLACVSTAAGSSGRCGAVLVTRSHLITAAHCVMFQTPGGLQRATVCTATYGGLTSTLDSEPEETYQTMLTQNIVYHAAYDPITLANDVGMLRMPNPIATFTSRIAPINLPKPGTDFQGMAVSVLGWGVTETGSTSAALVGANTQIRTTSTCNSYWNCPGSPPKFDADKQVCYAGYNVNGICSGDSGGPVIAGGAGTSSILVGINSFVKPGSDPSTASCTYAAVGDQQSAAGSSDEGSPAGELSSSSKLRKFLSFVSSLAARWIPTSTAAADGGGVGGTGVGLADGAVAAPLSDSAGGQGSTGAGDLRGGDLIRHGRQLPGTSQCRIDTPSVGTRVNAYLSWMQSAMSALDVIG